MIEFSKTYSLLGKFALHFLTYLVLSTQKALSNLAPDDSFGKVARILSTTNFVRESSHNEGTFSSAMIVIQILMLTKQTQKNVDYTPAE